MILARHYDVINKLDLEFDITGSDIDDIDKFELEEQDDLREFFEDDVSDQRDLF